MARLPAAGRTTAIILAIALAAVATFAIYSYVDNADDRAKEQFTLVNAFRASGLIRAGTPVETAQAQGLIEPFEAIADNLPGDVVGQLGDIANTIAVTDILPGDLIRRQRWGDSISGGTGAFEVPEELNAISLRVGVVEGVSGFISQDDHVSIIVHYSGEEGALEGEPDAGFPNLPGQPPLVDPALDVTGAEDLSRFIIQDAQVLAVGQRVVNTNQQGQVIQSVLVTNDSVLLTIAVTEQQAEQLVFAANTGSLTVTLLPDEFEPQPTPGRRFRNLFS